MRTLAKIYFRYSKSSSLTVAALAHHGSARSLSGTTGNGTSATSEADGRSRPWRAACGSSTSPRSATGSRALCAQRRVSIALPSVLSERSKSTQQRTTAREFRIEARDLVGCGRAIGAADEQALAAAGRQQLDRVADARGAAGERDDAVGIAVERRPRRPGRRQMNHRKPSHHQQHRQPRRCATVEPADAPQQAGSARGRLGHRPARPRGGVIGLRI